MVRIVTSTSLAVLLVTAAVGCTADKTTTTGGGPKATTPATGHGTPAPAKTTPKKHKAANPWVTKRPAWLGQRVLPVGPEGFGVAQPTPEILRDRRLATLDFLPPLKSNRWHATIDTVPDSVAERSTWRPKCPVTLDQLAYLTMPFWGFDHEVHTGEMIVNASVAEEILGVFRSLYEAHFPIEEMRVVSLREQRAWRTAPTGDTNITSSFECRAATQGTSWSMHAYGLAVDINPFHNPYLLGDLVAPELASAYLDRSWTRPGMVFDGDVVTSAFGDIGWGWGGRWTSPKDWMHFSQNGR